MQFTRRRLLCVAGAALAAGCSESEEPTRDGTVTPVEVPRSPEGALSEAVDVPVPTVPTGVLLGDDHRRQVIEHLEELRDRSEADLADADGIDPNDIPRELGGPGRIESAGERIESLAESSDPERFRRVDRKFRSLGRVAGYARARSGGLDVDRLREALESEQSATDALVDGVEYRIAPPVARHLPTVEAAEQALGHAENRLSAAERAVEAAAEAEDSDRSTHVGTAWGRIEQARIARTNAAGFLGTATDPAAPSRRESADRQRTERMRTVLSSVLSRASEVHERPVDEAGGSERVGELLTAVRVRNEAHAFVGAAESTLERLDGDSFPPGAVVEEKRRAVNSVSRLAETAPLKRELGGLAEDIIEYGDRLAAGSEETNALTGAHFVYVGARRFVERSLASGERLSAALDGSELG
ncbi:hypothetical protein BRD07_04945 [Halobacteriales archaeon QS_9_68_42]|nr:MAG: hypothetical protein BRD07_04945 [Halobacteriales archaeon QS_9_68_42]